MVVEILSKQWEWGRYYLEIDRSITLISSVNIFSNTYKKGAYRDKRNISNNCGDIK